MIVLITKLAVRDILSSFLFVENHSRHILHLQFECFPEIFIVVTYYALRFSIAKRISYILIQATIIKI